MLEKSGYKHELQFIPEAIKDDDKKRKRSRNVIWFNPPYNSNVATNVGKYFLTLVSKHFPSNHRLRKIFNRNTLKISCGCMLNIKSLISVHNWKTDNNSITGKPIMTTENIETKKERNGMKKKNCLLENRSISGNIVY